MDKPQVAHHNAAKQILQYLQGKLHHALQFSSQGQANLLSFADTNWGRDLDTRCSNSGIVVKFGDSSVT
jgi:hypothetical protein